MQGYLQRKGRCCKDLAVQLEYSIVMDTIKILAPDPSWPEMFLQEKQLILDCLIDQPVLDIHHFGSTAIAGMPAKPIIDMMISVPSVEHARQKFLDLLEGIGYDYWHGNPQTDRLFFVKGMPPKGAGRTHHLHVHDSSNIIQEHLAFRDYLRENQEDAGRYARFKETLAIKFSDDREAYTEAKTGFVGDILAKAGR